LLFLGLETKRVSGQGEFKMKKKSALYKKFKERGVDLKTVFKNFPCIKSVNGLTRKDIGGIIGLGGNLDERSRTLLPVERRDGSNRRAQAGKRPNSSGHD
jgi:hypothetical protein